MANYAASPRIGILGGTFNPIHHCHVAIAHYCREAMALEQVRLIPSANPPHKHHQLAAAEHRLAMVRLALTDQDGLAVDDLELHRDGPSYAIDTLSLLTARDPHTRWTYIVGLDALLGMASWHRPEDILRRMPLAVPLRPGSRAAALTDMPLLATVDFTPLNRASGDHPTVIRSADGIHITLLPCPPCPHSATAIRAAIHHGERAPTGLSPRVIDYIMSHHLYA